MIWGFDTETDHDGTRAWIVQWCLFSEGKVLQGTDRKALTQRFLNLGRAGSRHYIYIHNLKYDLEFIKYCFWTLAGEYGAELNPIFRNGRPIQININVNRRTLIFRDSMQKWQGSLRSLGDAINCPKLENIDPEFKVGWSGDIDYDAADAWEYIRRDAEICFRAGVMWHSDRMTKATTSGDAWAFAQTLKSKEFWDSCFPHLRREDDDLLRAGYFGGINISRFRGFHDGPITHEDKVSMFPGVMVDKPLPIGWPIDCGCVMPSGSELWVGRLTVKLSLRDGHIPWFTFKNGIDYCGEDLKFGQHVEHTREWHTLTLCSVDWLNLAEDYEIKIQNGSAHFWTFASKTGIFRDYIKYWGDKKKNAAKGSAEREHAKRMLNALYGRFAMIPDKTTTTLEMNETRDDLIWVNHEEKGEPTAYLPYAMFTSAWARRELMDRVRLVTRERGINAVLHCDTDSVIYVGEPIGGYGSEIGEWALESQPCAIYEGGFKRYIEIFPGEGLKKFNVTCAGVPQPKRADGLPTGMWVELLDEPERILNGPEAPPLGNEHYCIKSDWLRKMYLDKNKNPDDVNTMKLLPRKVPGGVILEGHTHQLDDGLKIRLCRSL